MANGLAERVNQRAQVAHPDSNGTVAKAPATLADQIRDMQEQFALAMPRGAEAQQLVRDALSLIRTTKHLAECDAQSVLGGLMTFAQLGLRPGVLGHGWLIPFKKRYKDGNVWRDRYEAQIVIGYKGYAELVHRSQAIETMVGRAVHEADIFDMEYGLEDRLVHKPAMKGDRGPVVGYYAIIKYKGGGYVFWYMTRDEGIEWRNKFSMAAFTDRTTGEIKGSGPWFEMTGPAGGTGFDQMVLKTCFLRAARWAPKGTDLTLGRAMEVDGAVRFDVDVNPDSMLQAEHPENDGVVDGEVVDEPTSATADDRPATDAQGKAIAAILRAGKVTADDDRRRVLSHILGRNVPSQKDLGFADASTVIDTLNQWQSGGTLAEDLAAIVKPAQQEPTPGDADAVDGFWAKQDGDQK